MSSLISIHTACFLFLFSVSPAQTKEDTIDIGKFWDSAHHWYDINDEVPKLITPSPNQKQYDKTEISKIAENILLYQRSNGGWPKNYDMRAILSEEQKQRLIATKDDISLTTFDNGATHPQVEYLARAFSMTGDERFKESCLKGIDFILSAQYPNGGFPQFFPDTKGYRKYITFNDGAMAGVMKVLRNIVYRKRHYSFVEEQLHATVQRAFDRGIECILRCQISVNDTLTAWCQQHDHITLQPQHARTFEPKAICSMESAEIVELLMSVKDPKKEIVDAVNAAVRWFQRSEILGIKVARVKTTKTEYIYHSADFDKVVVEDETAPPIWARMYEMETNRPLFCKRSGTVVYSLSEVEPERRTGYAWYVYDPEDVFKKYPRWQKKYSPAVNALSE